MIEKQGAREKRYEELIEELPEDDCRYVLVDLEFVSGDGRPTSELVFIAWNPDTAKIVVAQPRRLAVSYSVAMMFSSLNWF